MGQLDGLCLTKVSDVIRRGEGGSELGKNQGSSLDRQSSGNTGPKEVPVTVQGVIQTSVLRIAPLGS